jgi:hypothetical protein
VYAIDWSELANPNGVNNFVVDILLGLVTDAQQSAINGVQVGRVIGTRLAEAGVNPNNLMLIGHSNGAGLMASAATAMFTRTHVPIAELAALDAPYFTASYSAVADAAPAVRHLDNFYMPLQQSTHDYIYNDAFNSVVPQFLVDCGFGLPILSASVNVTNFELNNQITDSLPGLPPLAHSQVPRRYADAATRAEQGGEPWGFAVSAFATGAPPNQVGWIWKEVGRPGHYERVPNPSPRRVVDATVNGFINAGLRSVVMRASSVWDHRVSSVGTALRGFNTELLIPTAEAPSLPVIYGEAHSPVFASVDVRVPSNSSLIGFDISVMDEGNQDTLYVLVGTNIVGVIDLAAQRLAGGGSVQFWIGEYAGQTVTVNFLMPSGQPSSARFLLSNLEFLTVTVPPRVQTVLVNDDSAQRSMVNSLSVTFNTRVTLLPGAFELVRNGTESITGFAVTLTEVDGRTVAQFTFSGTGFVGGSLPDGNYTFRVRADRVREADSFLAIPMQADLTYSFFRFFGDIDGDRDVDNLDFFRFRNAFGKRAGDLGYLWYLDFDGDGDIDGDASTGDYGQFNLRRGKRLVA